MRYLNSVLKANPKAWVSEKDDQADLGNGLKDILEKQAVLETGAIELFKRSVAVIDDPEAVGVMKHALHEEKRHRKESKERLATW